ncbi:hypothetical protein PR048_003370 [Dryococelus australis]|uniref:Uncharacterized protein n=1 Tax=Dryococelus australis TaxID=614101 RepID=A0ABQ9IMS5_9NEOP|nr:hypothetical protein PR048_003370 [Dryococelus australis]
MTLSATCASKNVTILDRCTVTDSYPARLVYQLATRPYTYAGVVCLLTACNGVWIGTRLASPVRRGTRSVFSGAKPSRSRTFTRAPTAALPSFPWFRPSYFLATFLHASAYLSRTSEGGRVGIVPDDAFGRRVFSEISRLPRLCIPALLNSHVISPSLDLKIPLLRAAHIAQLNATRTSEQEFSSYRLYTVNPLMVAQMASESHQNILAASPNVSETLAGERRSVTPASLVVVGIHGIPRRVTPGGHKCIVPGRGEGEVGLRLRRGAAQSAPAAARNITIQVVSSIYVHTPQRSTADKYMDTKFRSGSFDPLIASITFRKQTSFIFTATPRQLTHNAPGECDHRTEHEGSVDLSKERVMFADATLVNGLGRNVGSRLRARVGSYQREDRLNLKCCNYVLSKTRISDISQRNSGRLTRPLRRCCRLANHLNERRIIITAWHSLPCLEIRRKTARLEWGRYFRTEANAHNSDGQLSPAVNSGESIEWVNFTVQYSLEPMSFLNWLLRKPEHVIGVHNYEAFIYWCRVTQGVSHKVWSNDKLVGTCATEKSPFVLIDVLSILKLSRQPFQVGWNNGEHSRYLYFARMVVGPRTCRYNRSTEIHMHTSSEAQFLQFYKICYLLAGLQADRFDGPKAGIPSILPHCNCTRMSKTVHCIFSTSVLRAVHCSYCHSRYSTGFLGKTCPHQSRIFRLLRLKPLPEYPTIRYGSSERALLAICHILQAFFGTTVAERLARSPPTKANRVQSPGRVTGFSQVGIMPDDTVGRRVFSGISRFPCPLIPSVYDICKCVQIYKIISRQGELGSIPGGFTPKFRKRELCRTMPLIGGFSRGSVAFRRCSIIASFHSQRLSQDLVVNTLRSKHVCTRATRSSFVEYSSCTFTSPADAIGERCRQLRQRMLRGKGAEQINAQTAVENQVHVKQRRPYLILAPTISVFEIIMFAARSAGIGAANLWTCIGSLVACRGELAPGSVVQTVASRSTKDYFLVGSRFGTQKMPETCGIVPAPLGSASQCAC